MIPIVVESDRVARHIRWACGCTQDDYRTVDRLSAGVATKLCTVHGDGGGDKRQHPPPFTYKP